MNPIETIEVRRRKRVVHVTSAHRWSDNRVHLREAASLAEAGYSVFLVAIDHDVDIPATGVEITLLPERGRLNRLVIGSIRAVVAALRTRPDVVHLHDPELVWSVPFLRALGKKVIYDAHEDLPAQVMDKHYLRPSVRRFVARIARWLMRLAATSDRVIAATDTIADTFPRGKTSVVHNYPRLAPAILRVAPVEHRPLVVAYVGALSIERGAEQLVDTLADEAWPRGWSAQIAGTTSPPSLIAELEARPGWSLVDFRGQIAPDAARELLRGARIGLVLLQRTSAFVDSLPTKMFEYMAEGLPIIASDFPLWRSILEKYDCGTLVDETNPNAIAQAVAHYECDIALLRTHSRNAFRAATEDLNWASEQRTLIEVYDKLILSPS